MRIGYFPLFAVLIPLFTVASSRGQTAAASSTKFLYDARGFSCPEMQGTSHKWAPTDTLWWTLGSVPDTLAGDRVLRILKRTVERWDVVFPYEIEYVETTPGRPVKNPPDMVVLFTLGGLSDPLTFELIEAFASLPNNFVIPFTTPCDPRALVFMTEMTSGPVKWSIKDSGPETDQIDFESAAIHEWGHMLGLVGHCEQTGNPACVTGMVMGETKAGQKHRFLTDEDKTWMRALYK